MNKMTLKTEWLSLLLIAFAIGLSIWAYPQLPEKVASHWNFAGEVDGWSSRLFHAIFFPALLIGMYVMFIVLPYLDPKKERYGEFMGVYRMMRDAIIFVMASVFTVATLYNLGYDVNVGVIVPSLIGVMFIVMGNYFGKIKRNWFVGIKTPWTLSSENIWNKTHRLGGRLFMIFGLLLALSPWLTFRWSMALVLGGVGILVFGIYVYSYIQFRKEKKDKKSVQ